MERKRLATIILLIILPIIAAFIMFYTEYRNDNRNGRSVETTKDIGNQHYHIKYNGKGWETKAYTFSDVNTTYWWETKVYTFSDVNTTYEVKK